MHLMTGKVNMNINEYRCQQVAYSTTHIVLNLTTTDGFKMWPNRGEMAVLERFLGWANRVFAATWSVISELEQFFPVATETTF